MPDINASYFVTTGLKKRANVWKKMVVVVEAGVVIIVKFIRTSERVHNVSSTIRPSVGRPCEPRYYRVQGLSHD